MSISAKTGQSIMSTLTNTKVSSNPKDYISMGIEEVDAENVDERLDRL